MDQSPSELSIRPAAVEDIDTVTQLFELARAEAPPSAQEDADATLCLSETARVWLAELSRAAVGFVVLRELDRHRASFRWLWVAPHVRRQGIGTRLLQEGLLHSQRCGYLKVVLEVPLSREAAVGIFQAVGFTFARERQNGERTSIEFYLDLYREPGL